MRTVLAPSLLLLALLGTFSCAPLAHACMSLGTGNGSLLGGDLTDPEDHIVDRGSYAGDLPEDQLKPRNANWVRMRSAPNNPPGTPPHQRHPYQSWQDAPACAIFLNRPEERKWYVSFKDGGGGGPTVKAPYFAAVQFAEPVLLTHFTLTTASDMPGRDPRVWAIQGSDSGLENEWSTIYGCNAKERSGSPLRESPRCETTLFTSFTSDNMPRVLKPADLKKIEAKLGNRKITAADFPVQSRAYTWFRIVIYACFNSNTKVVANGAAPSGFALAQLELFGTVEAPPLFAKAATARPLQVLPQKVLDEWRARLAKKLDAMLKVGAKLTVDMAGQGTCAVRGANEDALIVNVQGNDLPVPWRQVPLENCARLAKEAAKDGDLDALLTAAVFHVVSGDEKEAESYFARAGAMDEKAVRTTKAFLEAEAAKVAKVQQDAKAARAVAAKSDAGKTDEGKLDKKKAGRVPEEDEEPVATPSAKAPSATAPAPQVPFIISYWCGPPRSETTLERYKEIAEAGFNVAFPAIDMLWSPIDKAGEEHNRKYLDLCQQVGIKALVWDGSIPKGDDWKKHASEEIPHIEKALDGIIAKYSSHPALLGYVVTDEPSTDLFPRLGLVNQYLLKKDPQHLPYINLLPAYAFNPRTTYEEHVSKYIETVKPALVSWDHYRQMFEGGDESSYWYNLEVMRKLCLQAGVPFNQIIVSLKHMGYRECSEADLRWQVYTSLAYGSRGIQYFTYWDVKELAWAGAPAIITLDGKRDVKYEYVKRINRRIAALGPTLVRLTSTGAYCTDPLPPGAQRLAAGAPVKQADGGPMLIGCFNDPEGKQYVFVVNRSFNDRITAKLVMDPKLVSATEVPQDPDKPLLAAALTQKGFEVPLEAGEGRLFLVIGKD